ncbi:glycoside hydrolase family 43 protein [Olivibacter sp. 47]|uniref:glycoside hydrolase family 43 protein n=1 Tax=Olivibacter sp. 47 TaxID=3056486 RepID=UPI0025A40E1A|nr:glycoside hydrolase family 43 protein [Olivibacter sp. 47]MDM8175889.1 glycoside hydrolase family 43 protein [Olivibacter sp. 47]
MKLDLNNCPKVGILAALLCILSSSGFAQNPIIQTKHTADPAPMVYKDTVYLYTGHDEDDAFGFKMTGWLLYTSTDMVNWQDRGPVASLKNFKWVDADNGAWAAQCVERNGKFYLYCTVPGGVGIGVLVSDSPYGPFVDPIGKPLVKNSNEDIDPTVMIDDDGQAYMYWGNPNLWYVKLKEDMISIDGEIVKDSSFAKLEGQKDPFRYQEGPWAWKKNGNYYMAYASTCCPEGIGYAMGKSATGPWVFKGMIMDRNSRSNGNHPGIIDYKGKSYVFGFNYEILKKTMSKHYERRSVCLTQLVYNEDGTLKELPFWTSESVEPVGTLNPYRRTEAETIAFSEGLKTEKQTEWERNIPWDKGAKIADRVVVSSIHNGDHLMVRAVDFSKGIKSLDVNVASLYGGKIEVYLDSINGPLLGVVNVNTQGEGDIFRTVNGSMKNITGKHDVFFVFKGKKDLFYFDWWQFKS